MASGLVQKCTVHFAVEVGSRSHHKQSSSVRLKAKGSFDLLFKEVSVRFFGPLLVRTRVRLLHSHLLKRTALRGKTNSSAIQPN